MTERQTIVEYLSRPEESILGNFPGFLRGLDNAGILDLLEIMEDTSLFRGRLPLRLKIYAEIYRVSDDPYLSALCLLGLLRRLGSRTDLPKLGELPESLSDFADYMAVNVHGLLGDSPLADALANLAYQTRAFRSGNLDEMHDYSIRGLENLRNINGWAYPSPEINLENITVSETCHEIMFIAINSYFRRGDFSKAAELAGIWSEKINLWENILGTLNRQRYQYYLITGHLQSETGLNTESIESYKKALEYAPTPYRKAFLWMSIALAEKDLGHIDECWRHGLDAIRAWLDSPYPQAATTYIEWLRTIAVDRERNEILDSLAAKAQKSGGREMNRIVRIVTDMYRLLAEIKSGADPSNSVRKLDSMITEVEKSGSWSNLVMLMATKAVIEGSLENRDAVSRTVKRAREIISGKFSEDARPPQEFILENAHALALRNIGEYDEAFNTLFERALEARKKYPGGYGPDEKTAIEALFYLGALAGYDPGTIEKKISNSIKAGS